VRSCSGDLRCAVDPFDATRLAARSRGARFRISDSKAETGIREVQMGPDLIEPVIEHLDRLRRIGAPTGSEDYMIPNTRGGRIDRQHVGKIVGEAAALANEQVTARGLPPLPHVTPHSLRRTYISIALLANNFDVSSAVTERTSTGSYGSPASNRMGTDWGLTPERTPSTFPTAFPPRLRIPLHRAPAAKWREPDSNRRHHDFQWAVAA
jgi:hypothetical protein